MNTLAITHNSIFVEATKRYPKGRDVRYLEKYLATEEEKKVYKLLKTLLFIICIHTNIWPGELRSNRKDHCVNAKKIYSLIAKRMTKATESMIGAIIHRDHSTAHYLAMKAEEHLEIYGEGEFKNAYEFFTNEFKYIINKLDE
jgi:chromosomal replication initiation ATPase DnaA